MDFSKRNHLTPLERVHDISVTHPQVEPLTEPAVTHSLEGIGGSKLGWLPVLSLSSAFGLLLIAIAFRASRMEAPWAEFLYWTSLFIIVAPLAFRLASAEASRSERLGLVFIMSVSLYLVKVLHSPFTFTFSDEPVHLYNVQEILRTRFLFSANPLLSATPFYPGLHIATAALASFSGFSPFLSGLLMVGAARLLLALGLFLFHEQVSGSARVAGIAAILYTGHSTYLYWSAQFAYESLSLPLTVLLLYLIARNEISVERESRVGRKALMLILLGAIVITHHLTSYAAIVFLIVISILYSLASLLTGTRKPDYWMLTILAIVTTLSWLLYTANLTFEYLLPVISNTIRSVFAVTVTGEPGRELFQSSAGEIAPFWERASGILYIVFLLLAMPFGLLRILREYRHNVLAVTLIGAALLYFPLLGLRFTPAGWEPSNRSSAYLFVGISFVMALGIERFWLSRRPGWLRKLLFTGFVFVVFTGGIISGWIPSLRLSQPYLLSAGGVVIEPPGVQAARWAGQFLGAGNRIALDESNARQMLTHGNQFSLTGSAGGIQSLIFSEDLNAGEMEILNVMDVDYVLFDRRLTSWDNMLGMYYNPVEGSYQTAFIQPDPYRKFDRAPDVDRLFDSGNIYIYDVRGVKDKPQ